MMLSIVSNIKLLNKLATAGHITLHADTGRKLNNGKGPIAVYIDDYKYRDFTHDKTSYVIQYKSGCFFPFVYRVHYNTGIHPTH